MATSSKKVLRQYSPGAKACILLMLITCFAWGGGLMACGGGGGSSAASPPDDTTGDTQAKEDLLLSMKAALAAMAQEAERGSALEKLALGNRLAGSFGADDASDGCTTVAVSGDRLVMTFDGSEECQGVSGTLEITPAVGHDPDNDIIVSDITLIDFSTGDGCPVNGEERSRVTLEEDGFTAVCNYTDLDVCGQSLSGQVVILAINPEGYAMLLDARGYTLESGVEVSVEMEWRPETGTMSGDLSAIVAGETYFIQAEALVIDDACGLPTSGKLAISTPDGESAGADFTATSCEIPQAMVEYKGTMEAWTLLDRPRS